MQSASWYLHRFKAMSPAEVWWRASAAARDAGDALRYAAGVTPSTHSARAIARVLAAGAPPRLCDVARGEWRDAGAGSREDAWRDRLVAQADAIAAHRFRIFGREVDAGTPVAWNRDHALGLDTPLGFASWIDYRDRRIAGDAKVVWEPNRHHHLVVLARAYRATGEARFAAEAIAQMTGWLDQCPFPRGMNWRSPLELAIRAINWVWTLDLIADSGLLTPDLAARLADALYLHVWDTARKFSRGSSANNHLIGEAAGVFVTTAYFDAFDEAARWREEAAAILEEEIVRQTFPEGATREQAFAYHLFVLQLLLTAGLAGRRTGHDLSDVFWRRVEKMIEFAGLITEGGPLPLVGDADDGYVLDLGRGSSDLQPSLCVGAILFARSDFRRWAGEIQEPARWWLGAEGVAAFDRLGASEAPGALRSRGFEDAGYYLLQCGTAGAADSISAVVDCGPLGFTSLAAHGHADALSVVVRAFGRDILVDPGTYDYFTYPEWREYYRSTRAHNTVEVDRVDQSVQLGLFLWGAHAQARRLEWRAGADVSIIAGEHDGYRRLEDPVTHRRIVTLVPSERTLMIRDELEMAQAHEIRLFFHFAEDCDVSAADGRWVVTVGPHQVVMTLDSRLSVTLERGREQPIAGWVSRGYHQRSPAPMLVGELRASERLVLQSRFDFRAGAPA